MMNTASATNFGVGRARRSSGAASKFPGIMYQTLKNKRVFADFPNAVLAEQ